MFSALESNWDQSTRRGWTTLASFTMQALGLSLFIAVSWLWIEGPPSVHWLQFSAPAAFTPTADTPAPRGHHTPATGSNSNREQIIVPQSIPLQIVPVNDADSVPAAPDFTSIGNEPARRSGDGIAHGIGEGIPVVIPAHPGIVKPLLVSILSEANLLRRVQPIYPPIAHQAGIHGIVQLRAIISKAGTIENLVVVSGHPMLVQSAIEAVRQWRYCPYLLNHEPVEVETEITVNFVLSGG